MNDENTSRPGEPLDEAIQRELDEALGGMSVFDVLDGDAARKGPATTTRAGTILAVHGDDVFVDLGGKSQGVLPAKQFEEEPPKVGDQIEVVVDHYDADEGLVMLSLPGAVQEADWDTLAMDQLVEGRVTGHNKGGLELTINGIRAFMPISQIEMFRVDDLHPYVDQQLRCQVIELDPSEGNLLVSRRALLEREAAAAREELFAKLAEGQTVEGTVKTVMPYGAFVDIGGTDGLLHVRDMSHRRVDDPNDVVKPGQKLAVMVLRVDREERKIGLGLKQVLPDPWVGAETKWPVQTVVSGRVCRLADFGAFVELEEGVDGLVPIGEITHERRLRHPNEVLNEGQIVKVRVMNVDLPRKRISLSIKQVGDDPWMGASARWPADSAVEGTVTRITDFGAFIAVATGVEGLAHISELSAERVRSVGDVVKEGDTVRAKVLSIDEDQRRMSLSIKQLAGVPDETGAADATSSAPAPAKKRKKPLRGGFD